MTRDRRQVRGDIGRGCGGDQARRGDRGLTPRAPADRCRVGNGRRDERPARDR